MWEKSRRTQCTIVVIGCFKMRDVPESRKKCSHHMSVVVVVAVEGNTSTSLAREIIINDLHHPWEDGTTCIRSVEKPLLLRGKGVLGLVLRLLLLRMIRRRDRHNARASTIIAIIVMMMMPLPDEGWRANKKNAYVNHV